MFRIETIKGRRYSSIKEVPIKKEDVLGNTNYYLKVQTTYDGIREKLSEKTKKVYGERHTRDIWMQITSLYDRNFLNKFIFVWQEKVFLKVGMCSCSEEINSQREKEIIDECLNDESIQTELEEYFLSDFWKNTHLSELYTNSNN